MAAKSKPNTSSETQSDLVSGLRTLMGSSTSLDIDGVDSVLLWAAVVGLAKRGASLQIGLTQAKDSWSLQMWDGQAPVKDYFRDTDALNAHLAAVARVTWKREAPAQVEELIRQHGF